MLANGRALRHFVRRFWQLPRTERHLLVQALCWVPVTHWGVRCVGFKRGCRLMVRLATLVGAAVQTAQPVLAIPQCEQALHWAVRYGLHPGNCLSRALTLWWLLRQCGVQGELRIGVRMVNDRFQAHAWIEYEGQPLSEVADVRHHYATFQDELFATLA